MAMQFPNYSAAAFKGGPVTGITGFQGMPKLAGSDMSKTEKIKNQLKDLGIDTSSPTGGLIALNLLQKEDAGDINKTKQEGEYFKGLMNELADAAQKRAMEANVFAGIINLPNQFSRAMAEKYRYFPETMEVVAQGIRPGTTFANRQYINL